jgi:hypothetical protein
MVGNAIPDPGVVGGASPGEGGGVRLAAAQATEVATRAVRRPVPELIVGRPSKRRPTWNHRAESPYMFSNALLPPPTLTRSRIYASDPNLPE